jgi:hypothetical protein
MRSMGGALDAQAGALSAGNAHPAQSESVKVPLAIPMAIVDPVAPPSLDPKPLPNDASLVGKRLGSPPSGPLPKPPLDPPPPELLKLDGLPDPPHA